LSNVDSRGFRKKKREKEEEKGKAQNQKTYRVGKLRLEKG
jgi:hypothetical protein